MTEKIIHTPELLLSTDSLGGYGLDLIFEVAKNTGFDGIDLAIWKNFDAWNISYVKRLTEKYEFPVKIIQTSNAINAKEINQALDLAYALGSKVISINAPSFFNFSSYNFLTENLAKRKKDNPEIKFSIINPDQGSFMGLPMIPKYRFNNLVQIIKVYGCKIGLDIVNMEEEALENNFMRKISNFIPHISVVYFSDKTKLGERHVIPGEGVLKLTQLLKKLKQNQFQGDFSLKLDLPKKDLADADKISIILRKCNNFFDEYFENISGEI